MPHALKNPRPSKNGRVLRPGLLSESAYTQQGGANGSSAQFFKPAKVNR